MSDTKVSDMTPQTSPALEDLFYTVDDPGGSPISLSITLANLLQLPFAQIYTTGGSGTQDPGTSYVKLTQFDSDGISYLATADSSNDKITLTNTGMYLVLAQFSFTSSDSNFVARFRVYWNSVAQTQCTAHRKVGTGSDVGSCSVVGVVDVTTASTDLEVYAETDIASKSIDIEEAQLFAIRIAST